MNARFATPHTTGDSTWEMPIGMVLSVLLHLAIAVFAIFGLPFIVEPPPPIEEAIPVDLVPLGEKTTAPPPKAVEQKPAEKPPEPPKQEVKPPEPKPEPPKEQPKPEPPKPPPPPTPAPPPPPPAPTPPPPEPKAEVPLPAPEKKPEPPKEVPKPPDQLADIKPPPKKPPPPKDDFDSLLKTLDKMKAQPKTEEPPKKQKPDDLSALEKTLQDMQKNDPSPPPPSDQKAPQTNPNAEISLQPTASEMSVMTRQVEIHWNFDIGARDAANLVVLIHVSLEPDGTVTRAELVDDPRYNSDTFFRSAADAARRAVLAASPLKLPPNSYDKFKDFTYRFTPPRDALR